MRKADFRAKIKKIEIMNRVLSDGWAQSIRVVLDDIELTNENLMELRQFRPDEPVLVEIKPEQLSLLDYQAATEPAPECQAHRQSERKGVESSYRAGSQPAQSPVQTSPEKAGQKSRQKEEAAEEAANGNKRDDTVCLIEEDEEEELPLEAVVKDLF